MYENLIHQPPTEKHEQPFSIRLNPIPVHEKVGYIDSVCAALIDSRFGPGREWLSMIDLRSGPDRERAVFCDMTVEGPVPSYTILPDSEMARRYSNEIIRDELERINREAMEKDAGHRSPSAMARGSPEIFQKRRPASPGQSPTATNIKA